MTESQSLTGNLILEVNKSAQEFFRWSDQIVDKIGSSDVTYEQALEEYETSLETLKEKEQYLENLREEQNEVKIEQIEEIKMIEKEIERYKQMVTENNHRLQLLTEEKIQESARLENLSKLQREAQKAREKKINDLTRGIRLYRFLGLEFEKAVNDCMKFTFTQIDPSDPLRQFQFLLLVDHNDLYRLVDTSPRLDPELSDTLITQLNNDNNISYFVVNMRRAFQKNVFH